MEKDILDSFVKKNTKKYSVNTIWFLGIPLLFLCLIGLLFCVFIGPTDELTIYSQLLNSIFPLIFIFYTSLIVFRITNKNEQNNTKLYKVFIRTLLPIFSIVFTLMNIIPRRIYNAAFNYSALDEPWYFWPQTSFGFPSPYLRFFDSTVENLPNPVISMDSFIGNIFLFCILLYLLIGIYLLARGKITAPNAFR